MAVPLNLIGGAYRARALIASAQDCINLYVEKNPQSSQSAAPFTFYPRPGYRRLQAAPMVGLGRGCYCASNGKLFVVVGTNVYYVDANWTFTLIGTIALGTSIVSMADNGTDILMVDGTSAGYSIDLASNVMAAVIDPAFYGGDRVEYVGSAFMLNRIGTPQFYISGPNALTWDPLDFGQKTASPDPLVAVPAMNNQAWLLGTKRGEVWYYSGAADFPWQQLPGVLVEHGCAAKNSPASADKFLFWLTQDKDGKPWIAKGSADYSVVKASTFAIDNEIQGYAVWNDAVGYVKQQLGHTFYVINFPSANKTWQYDLSNNEWNRLASVDANGNLNRDYGQLHAYAYNTNVVVHWQNGNLLASDPDTAADDGIDFPCVRSFPHSVDTMQRISYRCFTANIATGQIIDPNAEVPQITFSQSVDRGQTFRMGRTKSLGAVGKPKTLPRWWRLDLARDSVFKLEWMASARAPLNGGFLEPSDMAET